VAPAESATVPRRPGSGHWPTNITEAKDGLHDGATQQCKQGPARPRPGQIAELDPTGCWRTTYRHRSSKPLDRI